MPDSPEDEQQWEVQCACNSARPPPHRGLYGLFRPKNLHLASVGIQLQVSFVECFPEHILEKNVPHTENRDPLASLRGTGTVQTGPGLFRVPPLRVSPPKLPGPALQSTTQ